MANRYVVKPVIYCINCTQPISKPPSQIKRGPGKFCSKVCLVTHRKNRNIEEVFLSFVLKTEYCWIWNGRKSRNGYGTLNFNWESIKAHRLSYSLYKGEISKGMFVCHTCDNPSCVNPSQLWLGTPQDNVDDKMKKGRHVSGNALKTHCKYGHELSGDNIKLDYKGRRRCLKCQKERNDKRPRANPR